MDEWGTIEQALDALRAGKAVVVMDDENRENEGDLVLAAQFSTPSSLAFMCRHTTGLLCAPLTPERAEELNLPPMIKANEDRNQTAFALSCDAIEGTTTGASAIDRAITCRALADPKSKATDFSRPGHMFPLIARPNGVLERQGHTEATVDLCKLAGLIPVGVIGELMSRDGTMMRLDACREFAATYNLVMINIQQIIEYVQAGHMHAAAAAAGASMRAVTPVLEAPLAPSPGIASASASIAESERASAASPVLEICDSEVALVAECNLPVEVPVSDSDKHATKTGDFQLKVYRSSARDTEHIVLVRGDVRDKPNVLTRIHSECFTGDTLGSTRCDCGQQLHLAIEQILSEDAGIVIYVRDHEGRGIGITNKIRAYSLQEKGLDTYKANQALRLPEDRRDYRTPAAILKHLGVASLRLMTNNPAKVSRLGVPITDVIPLRFAPKPSNALYLASKHAREHVLLDALQAQARAEGNEAVLATLRMMDSEHSHDDMYMRRALELARNGRCSAPPNPWVGAVIVKHGAIIGEGFHHRAGEPHAEVMAVRDVFTRCKGDEALARTQLRGATVYCTLEPCHHTGRTGPCDEFLIQHGIARVVFAVVDPDPRVAAAGMARLQDAGLKVTAGVLEHEARKELAPYLFQRTQKRAYCVLKAAMSLDGKVACADGSSMWITGEVARADVHKLRACSQAIMVGAGTALTDKPKLTVRVAAESLTPSEVQQYTEARAAPLLRVVLDGKGRVVSGPLMDTTEAPTLIFTTAAAPQASIELWKANGVDHHVLPEGAGGVGVDLHAALTELGRRGVLQVMVEGGAKVHAALLTQGLVDEMQLYYGAALLGASALSWPQGAIAATIAEKQTWTLAGVRELGDDLCATYTKSEDVAGALAK